jgi:hypothetical protein
MRANETRKLEPGHKTMTKAEMICEIAAATNSSRISHLHHMLNTCDLSMKEYLELERMMTARLYDGSMTPLPVAEGFLAYA